MLKCVYPTSATKLGIIAATYRSGDAAIFGSCPTSCPLLPIHSRNHGSTKLDTAYLTTERLAVPRKGLAWSYTHWKPEPAFINTALEETTLNVSGNTPVEAAMLWHQRFDVTYTAPATDTQWPRRINNVLFIRCPAEINKSITCQTCGNGRPLCSRQQRGYVIVFTAHGTKKDDVATKTGGCYAANFPCSKQWQSTLNGIGATTWNETHDHQRLVAWAQSLPPGTLLRHRIAGDLGCTTTPSPV